MLGESGDAAMIAGPRRPAPRRPPAPRDDGRRHLPAPARRRPGRALRARLRQVPRGREPARRSTATTARYVAARTGKRDGIAAPEVGAALYPFPHDRKLDARRGRARARRAVLPPTSSPGPPSSRRPSSAATRRDAWSRTPRCSATLHPGPHSTPSASRGCSRPPTASSSWKRCPGARLDTLGGEGLHALGTALAAAPRHEHKGGQTPFRFDVFAAGCHAAVHRRRGDRAGAARRGAPRRSGSSPACSSAATTRSARACCIHGDANLRNALLQPDGTVALLDLEDLSHGPAAADLGQVLAALIVNRTPHAARALLARLRRPARRAPRCAGTRPRRSSPARRCPPSAATAPTLLARLTSCSTPAPPCSPPTRWPHEARAALLLPAQRRPRAPDAQLRADRGARRALPRRAARAAASCPTASSRRAASRSSRCRRSA